ncbi:hypothetical protein NF212_11710 [Parasalinivibrio latis]|uniref:hypothetical protein n=1 Tax=Parasalinivibrio latis TaxID=2952610 RepID=UPI0030E3CD9A
MSNYLHPLLVVALLAGGSVQAGDRLNVSPSFQMSEFELLSYRGGFDLEGTFFRIGLSIETIFNDVPFFNSHIGGFTIKNGKLDVIPAPAVESPRVPVQPGIDNVTAKTDVSGNPVPTLSQPSENVTVIQSGIGNVIPESVTQDLQNSVVNIIQNSLNNQSIKVNTKVDIDANVQRFIRSKAAAEKLERSLSLTHY